MSNTAELLELVYVDLQQMGCNQFVECEYKERTISYALGVRVPVEVEDLEKVFKECCYTHFVFADLNSSEDFKNDYSGFYHQKQLPNETVDFVLYHEETQNEYPLIDSTYGSFFGFGYFDSNVNLKGYLIEWKKVLQEIGQGNFRIKKIQNISGITTEINSFVFTLKQFSSILADKTVRIDCVMNGNLKKTDVNFTGTSWKHSIRVPGFFGRREPTFEEDNIVNTSFEKRQISIKQTNEFKFQTNLIPDCITTEIFDFVLMANDIFMNDYNANNHSYNFIKFGVKLSGNEGTVYGSRTRKAQLNLTFNDKVDNNIKRNYS